MVNRIFRGSLVFWFALAAAAVPAYAEDDESGEKATHWVLSPPQEGLWSDPANWDNGVPQSSWRDVWEAFIDNGGTAVVRSPSQGCTYLTIGSAAGASGTVKVEGGDLTVVFSCNVGDAAGAVGRVEVMSGNFRIGSTEWLRVGHHGEGYFVQSGGQVSAYYLHIGAHPEQGSTVVPYAEYRLCGESAVLSVDGDMLVGEQGTGLFVQTAGTCRINPSTESDQLTIGHSVGADGTYKLFAGSLVLPGGTLRVARRGKGAFLLGDSAGTRQIREAGDSHAALTVRDRQEAEGEFRGWGDVHLTGTLTNNGRIVADAYGVDGRVLDLTAFSQVTNTIENPTDDTGTNGWYATNAGELVLPDFDVPEGNFVYTWGESDGDETLDLVNSMRLEFANVYYPGSMQVSLLAADHAAIRAAAPLPLGWTLLAAFRLGGTDIMFDRLDLTIRYEDTNEAIRNSQGEKDEEVVLLMQYDYDAMKWVPLSGLKDLSNHLVMTNDLRPIGSMIEPSDYIAVVHPLGGDANMDGSVDMVDLMIVSDNWGQTGRVWEEGDFNGDSSVDILDLTILSDNWGASGSDGAQSGGQTTSLAEHPSGIESFYAALAQVGLLDEYLRYMGTE